MKVVTSPDVDPLGLGIWVVRVDMYGGQVTIFTGSVYECCAYLRAASEVPT